MGRRYQKDVDGVSSEFAWSFNQEIEEYDDAGNRIREFVYRQGIDQPVWLKDTTLSGFDKRRYPRTDRQGSIIAITKRSGALDERYTYDAWGKPGESSNQPIRYTGRRYDSETGLYYYRARYYSPVLGRFLQTDPIGYAGGMNLYGYVGNNPRNFRDPSGLLGMSSGPVQAGTRVIQLSGDLCLVLCLGADLGVFFNPGLDGQPFDFGLVGTFETGVGIDASAGLEFTKVDGPASELNGLAGRLNGSLLFLNASVGNTDLLSCLQPPGSAQCDEGVPTETLGVNVGIPGSLSATMEASGKFGFQDIIAIGRFISSFLGLGSEKIAITRVCDENGEGCIEFRDGAASPSSGGGGFAILATDSTLCIFTGGDQGCEDR